MTHCQREKGLIDAITMTLQPVTANVIAFVAVAGAKFAQALGVLLSQTFGYWIRKFGAAGRGARASSIQHCNCLDVSAEHTSRHPYPSPI